MTRTVESPSGQAALTITPGDDGIVYLKAANDVSEVTVPLRVADLLASVADECGVLVIDRADLPEVEDEGCGTQRLVVGVGWYAYLHPSDAVRHHQLALGHLAIAEHLDAHPPVDAAQVEALTEALIDAEMDHPDGPVPAVIARRLVARGVRVGGER